MKAERLARWFIILVLSLIPLSLLATRNSWVFPWLWPGSSAFELHARMPENGGWSQTNFTVVAGQPLHLRMTSDDVMHSFAIGQSDRPAVDIVPGEVSQVNLTFDKPGRYTFYCTRWCGPNHWRMRGTIDVLPAPGSPTAAPVRVAPPYYMQLGIDLDIRPVTYPNAPVTRPSSARGAALGILLPVEYQDPMYYRTHSPAELWQAQRLEPLGQELSRQQTWDLVAWAWQTQATPKARAEGQKLYAQNCASCHGESGAGDGVFAGQLSQADMDMAMPDPTPGSVSGHETVPPAKFDRPEILSENAARLQGKILRGGMGTGMPYWGPIFTEDQIWALVSYLWNFSMEYQP